MATRSGDTCGEAKTLSCFPNAVENLFIQPTTTWLSPDGSEVPRGGNNNPLVDLQTGQLVFSDVTASNSGTYTCRAIINITDAQILNHYDDTVVIIDVEGKLNIHTHTHNLYVKILL